MVNPTGTKMVRAISNGQDSWLAPGPGSPVGTTCDEHVMNEHGRGVYPNTAPNHVMDVV